MNKRQEDALAAALERDRVRRVEGKIPKKAEAEEPYCPPKSEKLQHPSLPNDATPEQRRVWYRFLRGRA